MSHPAPVPLIANGSNAENVAALRQSLAAIQRELLRMTLASSPQPPLRASVLKLIAGGRT
jgi:hypothetical protein